MEDLIFKQLFCSGHGQKSTNAHCYEAKQPLKGHDKDVKKTSGPTCGGHIGLSSGHKMGCYLHREEDCGEGRSRPTPGPLEAQLRFRVS